MKVHLGSTTFKSSDSPNNGDLADLMPDFVLGDVSGFLAVFELFDQTTARLNYDKP